MERPGNYWHMLPEASQSRKAIWGAINPHSGMRRIDEVFPLALRRRTRDDEMMIEFVNGSTWQVVGSDNYRSLVGAPPVGLVFSEWSKSQPQAWAYLSPILAENNGWAIYATTPMGKNHAYNTHNICASTPGYYAQILPATATDVFSPAALEAERSQLIATYGDTLGSALYEQEYLCSPEAAILGAVYAREISQARSAGRIGLPWADIHVPGAPVYTSWDLGRSDATAIWWWQHVGGEIRVLEYEESSLENLDYYVSRVCGRRIINPMAEWGYGDHQIVWGGPVPGLEHRLQYNYGVHYLPHDAKAARLDNSGISIEVMVRKALRAVQVIESGGGNVASQLPVCRSALNMAWFSDRAADGIEALSNYRYGYDPEKMVLSSAPIHDWSSHGADAWRVLSHAVAGMAGVPVLSRTRYQISRPKRGSAWAR